MDDETFFVVGISQNTPSWLKWRSEKVGSSDFPIVIGVSPWLTPLQLWKQKLGFESSGPLHPGMIYGNQKESFVREHLQKKYGKRIDPLTVQNKELDWATASLDGMSEDGMIFEIKCPSEGVHQMAEEGRIPPYYYAQVQWQLFVTGKPFATYVSYLEKAEEPFVEVKVEYSKEYMKSHIAAAVDFYECMLYCQPPPPSERDHIRCDDPDFAKYASKYIQAKETLDEAQKQHNYYKEKLISLTDDSNTEGFGVKITRVNRDGSVDWKKLCSDQGISKETVDLYRKPQIGYWQISLKD